ncbi:hypothetical protein SADUNF_Sadunf17G0065600 [Salix dunnii]|uniref:Uncharacterized protein n=1 Tax=Salix dunnii TaxID=1413687 RepID=A0A835MH87_9ROSI|nr:hypothetical protein SADUNF_Sadunf17G0065600 [Salix dunnii]
MLKVISSFVGMRLIGCASFGIFSPYPGRHSMKSRLRRVLLVTMVRSPLHDFGSGVFSIAGLLKAAFACVDRTVTTGPSSRVSLDLLSLGRAPLFLFFCSGWAASLDGLGLGLLLFSLGLRAWLCGPSSMGWTTVQCTSTEPAYKNNPMTTYALPRTRNNNPDERTWPHEQVKTPKRDCARNAGREGS